MKYTLLDPVDIEGDVTTEIEFKERVCVKHCRDLPIGEPMKTHHIMQIAGEISGESDLVIGRISFRDMQHIIVLVMGFLYPGEESDPTGEKPSESSPQSLDSVTPS